MYREDNIFWKSLDSSGKDSYNWYIRGITTDIPKERDRAMSLEELQDTKSFKRVQRHKPVYLQVVEQIQQMIKEGVLAPGDQLLPERELAGKIGVSRTSVRQSLAILDGMGIIEITP